MKNKLLTLLAVASSMIAFSSCNGDKADDGWKDIPEGLISSTSGKASFFVNEVKSVGSAALMPQNDKEGKLTLMGMIPGYSDVNMMVSIKRDDDTHWSFSGETNLSEPPSIAATVRSEMMSVTYTLTVTGRISIEGEIEINAATEVSDMASAGLTGSWNIVRKCKIIGGNGPVHLTWKAGTNLGVGTVCSLVNTAGGVVIADKLDQITFNANGNVTIRYYEDDKDVDIKELLALRPGVDGDSFTFNASHTEWEDSPMANLVFWYALGDRLYIVPNISALNEDDGTQTGGYDPSEILNALAALEAYGVDLKALNEALSEIMTKGLAFRFTNENDTLCLYVDKEMCDKFITPLLPLLPMLDQLLESLATSGDQETLKKLATVKAIFELVGISKPSDIDAIWKATTEFKFELNFQKA